MTSETVAINLTYKDVFELVFADQRGRSAERNGTSFDGDHISAAAAVH